MVNKSVNIYIKVTLLRQCSIKTGNAIKFTKQTNLSASKATHC